MDFNPLDILAAAALGEKDAPSDVKTSKQGQTSSSGQTENSEAAESKDADEDSNKEMGKTTSNTLKHNQSAKNSEAMAPQKMPWSPGTLIPGHLEKIIGEREKCSIDDIVHGIKKKEVAVKNVSDGIMTNTCPKEKSDAIINSPEVKPRLNNNMVFETNNEVETASQTLDQSGDNENAKDNISKEQDLGGYNVALSYPNEDTMDLSDSKMPKQMDTSSDMCSNESIVLDHPYALAPGKVPTYTSYEEDDDIDVCSDSSPLSEDSEQRSHNLYLDCNYLKHGILEGVTASTLELYKMSRSAPGRFKLPSSSSSTSSPTSDLISRPSISMPSDEIDDKFTGTGSPLAPVCDPTWTQSPVKPALKYGKFKIGTFASFSSNNMELEKFLKNRDLIGNKKLTIGIPTDTRLISPSQNSPSAYPNVHPLLQSPSLDWDRSEAGSETQDDSSDARTPLRMSPDFTEKVTEWSHPVFHDHDYCAKDAKSLSVDDFRKFGTGKRKYTKRKNKLDGLNHEKILKAKYLKKELLRQDSFLKSVSEPEPVHIDPAVIKTNPVGRPRKRPFDKIIEEEIDPELGTKLKITGKFQDQYVYYLSKSSRTTTRRRQIPAPPFTLDKIIVPAPKPGDIVVPHLTDADIETVRVKGRSALNLPARPHSMTGISVQSSTPSSSHTSEFISDVDSHIVSTILSMESDSLASPVASQASDITSTVGLNPNQPELTESLRLMSGDPSITSEHVLNYLLSVVKDDGLLGNGSTFDASGSALFSSLQSDSIYAKADQTGESVGETHHLTSLGMASSPNLSSRHDLLDITKSVQSNSSFDSHAVLSTAHIHGPDHYVHSAHKDSLDENVSLPDDLSSFMSNSQGTSSSSNTTQDGDSHSSLKSMFGSDLSSLGTPQLSSSVPRLTSIEKTLDYLGVGEEDMKLDDSVFSTKMDQDADSTQALTPVSSTSGDDTPWIVTVTLYFNDVPAIMINNQPYIRLVDIHKQILPAKDTGILKKRCQLLRIPVLNCTEMQRYFLVQYGRAYNSKSTLIVSKEQATSLVTYYAIPQPRIGRADESHQRRPSSSGGSEGSARSPLNQPLSGSKKRVPKGSRKSLGALGSQEPEIPCTSFVQDTFTDTIQSSEPSAPLPGKRTRHKKINYLEMLKGEEKEKSSDAAILETIESVVKSAPDYVQESKSNKTTAKKKFKGDQVVSNRNGSVKKRFTTTFQKKNERGSKVKKEHHGSAQTTKANRSKSNHSDKPTSEREIDICSDVDTEDSMDLSQNKKFRPLKLKVNSLLNFAGQRKGPSSNKKGLFSCSNSNTSHNEERPLRVLAVAHQAALSGNNTESHLPSQPADIHLDLFTKSNSACVRCETCSQFLSVPHFMRHHHVPMDNEWLATEAAHRILVPRNKENISEQEKRLWEEFHRLQEAIGGFGEADDETDSDDGGYSDEDADDQNSLELSATLSSMLSVNKSRLFEAQMKGTDVSRLCESPTLIRDQDGIGDYTKSHHSSLPISSPISNVAEKFSCEALAKIGLVLRHSDRSGVSSAGLISSVAGSNTQSHLRTSSRKRKSKQLFSIENYYTPHRSLVDEETGSHKDSSAA